MTGQASATPRQASRHARRPPAGGRAARFRSALGLCLALAGGLAPTAASAADSGGDRNNGSAVVLLYHQVGEEARFYTSVSIAQFEAHLTELASARYRVLPIAEILHRLDAGPPLPERSVGISLDDAWLSSYRNAWPRLRAAGLPFTLFIASDHIDQGLKGYMDWPRLRELAASRLADIGIQGSAHGHLAGLPPEQAAADIEAAVARVEAELGAPPALFSYPYGEYGLALRDRVAGLGFLAAFGQQSGAFDAGDDRFALPRFAMSHGQGGLERLRLVAGALPLPAGAVTPRDPLLRGGPNHENPPRYGFTPLDAEDTAAPIACYADGEPVASERAVEGRLDVRLAAPFDRGRHRINCTQPGPDGRWRWRGALFTVLE